MAERLSTTVISVVVDNKLLADIKQALFNPSRGRVPKGAISDFFANAAKNQLRRNDLSDLFAEQEKDHG